MRLGVVGMLPNNLEAITQDHLQAIQDLGLTGAGVSLSGATMRNVDKSTCERVRQLFENGCLQSAYWHRFAATVHSPVGKMPQDFGVTIVPRPEGAFSKNDLDFIDPVNCNHDMLGRGLNKALYNFMLGIGFDEPMSFWFEEPVPPAQLDPRYIADLLQV